jgi:hypothetical protein
MDYVSSDKMLLGNNIDDETLIKHQNYIKKIAGPAYEITSDIDHLMKGMIYYLNGNTDKAKEYNMDTRKGIALIGIPGVGKTTFMKIMGRYSFALRINQFSNISIEKIIDRAMQGIIMDELKKPAHLCIHQFGKKYNIKGFGTDVNDLIMLIMSLRYELFQDKNIVTHITTNFGTKQFQSMFEDDFIDRMKEMFNMLSFPGQSFRPNKQ